MQRQRRLRVSVPSALPSRGWLKAFMAACTIAASVRSRCDTNHKPHSYILAILVGRSDSYQQSLTCCQMTPKSSGCAAHLRCVARRWPVHAAHGRAAAAALPAVACVALRPAGLDAGTKRNVSGEHPRAQVTSWRRLVLAGWQCMHVWQAVTTHPVLQVLELVYRAIGVGLDPLDGPAPARWTFTSPDQAV